MSTIVISGAANVFAKSPRATDPIADGNMLARFHGLCSEQACAETFDELPLMNLGISGGRLRFLFVGASQRLRITTAYHVPRRLTDAELNVLIDATKAQWSDGIGSGSFDFSRGTIYSTALAMALLNQKPGRSDIGRFFVDAYPLDAEDDPQVQFLEGDLPDKKDIDYLRESAEFGDPEAMGFMGDAYENGKGVPKDLARAASWYRRGADSGDVPCQAQLGECYELGKGVDVDFVEALRWYELALRNGLKPVEPAIARVRKAMGSP
jgi:hypothetical protein